MPQNHSRLNFLLLLGSAVVVTVAIMFLLKSGLKQEPGEPIGGLQPGEHAPLIEAQGWINGDAPSPNSLEGKVVVVEAWMLG